jgi:hypothetical protein
MWRNRPSNVNRDGGIAAEVSCAPLSPAHFITKVAR